MSGIRLRLDPPMLRLLGFVCALVFIDTVFFSALTPLRALAVEEALRGGASAAEAAAHAADGTSPGYDIHADAEYRKHLARVLTRRALEGKTG